MAVTPGDEPSVLVAMNPAALMADLHRLEPGGTVIINEDAFDERNLEKAGYTVNPLDDDTLANYRVLRVPMTSLTKEVCVPLGVKPRDAERSKNFFALGLVSWMFTRPTEVHALPCLPFRVAATQSNRSTPRAIPSIRSSGNPTPIR